MSAFEAMFIILFLGAAFFNCRSVKPPLYALLGFAIAASMPEPTVDLNGYLLGLTGLALTAGLIVWDWTKAWAPGKAISAEASPDSKSE